MGTRDARKHALRTFGDFVAIVLLSLMGLAVVFLIHAYLSYSAEKSIVYAKEIVRVDAARRSVSGIFEGIVSDVLVLADAEELEDLIEEDNSNAKRRVGRDFARFAERKRIYARICYVDLDGMEVVRVEFDGQYAVIVPQAELAADRPPSHIANTLNLPRGNVFVSPLSFSPEHRRAELPPKPIITFSTPVFDRRGGRRGAIAVSFLASRLVNEIKRQLSGSVGEMVLLDSDGSSLLESQRRDPRDFAGRYANVWSRVLSAESGQIQTSRGLFTYTTVYPEIEVRRVGRSAGSALSSIPRTETQAKHLWKIMTHITPEFFGGLARRHSQANLLLYVAIFALMTVGSAVLARSRALNRRSQEGLKLSDKVIEGTVEAVVATDADERIIDVNPAFTTLTGYRPDEALGQTPGILKSGAHPDSFYAGVWEAVRSAGSWQGEVWSRRKNGETFLARMHISTITGSKGRIENYVAIFSDVTDEKRAEAELERMALHDTLTGLPNRNLLHDRLSQGVAKARRNREKLAVLFVDLDDFKQINDTLGHEAGDVALAEVSRRLRNSLRASDTVARIGGDEFVVILQEADDRETITGTIEKVQKAISKVIMLDDTNFRLGASVGICIYPDDASDLDDLINFADAAMYRAKDVGPNAYVFYED